MTERIDTGSNLTEVVRKPIRPLAISDFVVEVLPERLEEVRAGTLSINDLSADIGNRLQDADIGAISYFVTGKEREIALLDLLILQSALGNSGGEVPQKLTDIIGHLAEREGRIPALTYEDVILVNPLDADPRTFTTGKVRETEMQFYRAHRTIEEAGLILNELVGESLKYLRGSTIDFAKYLLNQTGLPTAIILQEMFGLKELDKEDFATFRIYFGGYPKGNKGPSGAFSPAIATVDVLLSGRDLPEDRHDYLRDNRPYFPRNGQRDIDRAYELVDSVGALDSHRKEDLSIDEYASKLHQFLTLFRSAHQGRVGEQIPEALKGLIPGTGGEVDVATFLRERIKFNKTRRSL